MLLIQNTIRIFFKVVMICLIVCIAVAIVKFVF